MITSTPLSTKNKDRPPGPTSQQTGVTFSSLFAKIAPRLLMLLVLAASIWLAFALFTMPPVVPASAPANEFSAKRAMDYLRVVAKAPHPMDSPANAAVRTYLTQQIRALGLEPEVQTATVVSRWPGEDGLHAGTVYNVVARLKGTASTHAILLDAHYDSASTGPGASDEGSGVVTLLETMRALKAGPPLKNDVIFVFADGEEYGDLGARAFATQHPWMQEVGIAINFEAQGSTGPAYLYDISQQNGWLINEFLKVAPYPLVSSFVANIAMAMPEQQAGCDLEEYMARGIPGLDFIYTGNTPVYHTMQDNVQTIDPRSIQHEGSYTLALVRHFGSMDLSQIPVTPNDVFFNIGPGVVAHYASTWAIPLAVFVVLLFLAVLVLGFRHKRLTAGGFALGVLVSLGSYIGTFAMVILAWWALKAVNPNYQVLLVGYYGSGLAVLGLAALAIGVMSALFLWLRSKMRLSNLAAGALVWWAILLVLSSMLFPGGSYLFTWPLLFSVLALGWLFLTKEPATRPWLRPAILGLAAVPGTVLLTSALLLLVPWMNRFDALMGMPMIAVPVMFVVLLMGLLIPQLALLAGEPRTTSKLVVNSVRQPMLSPERRSASQRGGWLLTHFERWLVPSSAFLVSVVMVGVALGASGFDATHPGTDSITYQLNANTGQAIWLSRDKRLDEWTRQFFPTSSGSGPYQAPAPTVNLAAPTVALLSNTMSGGVRTLRVQVASLRHAEHAIVLVETQGEIVAMTLNDQPFDPSVLSERTRHHLQFTYSALPDKGFELSLSITSAAPVKVTVQDASYGLPSIAGMKIRPRPSSLMPAPGDMPLSEGTVVIKSYTFTR